MLFTDPIFAVFFAACFGLRWALRGYDAQKNLLLASSYAFYAAWDWRFVFLLLAATVLDYFVARALGTAEGTAKRRALLCVSLAGNLGMLGFFKYFNFFTESAAALLATLGLRADAPTLHVVLPIGISFFTFQTMSYVIDVYRRDLAPVRHFRDFALFVAFFPQLVAGPIVRAKTFLPQLDRAPKLADVDFRALLSLFLIGYLKKACIADNIASLIDPVFAHPDKYGARDALLAAFGYSTQIYCDFSGYTDMAIATAGLLGFELCKNFDAPYLSPNIRDFWRRWHMSLSSWLRDYLYVSLGGGRGSRFAVYRNLMLTMVLGGLWHGANMTFVLWGFGHGLALAAHRAMSERRKGREHAPSPIMRALGWAATFSWVVVLFTLFRCDSVKTFAELLSRGLAWNIPAKLPALAWALLLGLGAVHVMIARTRTRVAERVAALPAPAYAFALGAGVALALFFTPIRTTPFIYFQF